MAGTQTHLGLAQGRTIAVGLLVAALALFLGFATAQANGERSPNRATTATIAATAGKRNQWQAPPGAVKLPLKNLKKVGLLTCGRVKGSWRPGIRLHKRWFLDYRRASKNASRQAARLSRQAKVFRKFGKAAKRQKASIYYTKAKRVTRQAKKLRRKAKRLGKNYRKRVRICSASTETPPKEPVQTSGCFSNPVSCGYPDTTNTGASGTLTASGSVTLSAEQTLENREVTGSITVTGNNVTIRNVKVNMTDTGPGSCGICAGTYTGLEVIDTTVSGAGSGSQTGEAAVRNHGSAILEGDNLTLCNECFQGSDGVVKDTYMKVSSIYSGAHAEDIYFCSGSMDVEHSTMLNEQQQTATVFGDTICGGGNKFTVKNSLLAGGGYVLYPQANNSNPSGAETVIQGNHFARCLGSSHSSSGGTTCKGGSASNGYYPLGGYYGVGASFSGPTTWGNNVWDDNLAPVDEP